MSGSPPVNFTRAMPRLTAILCNMNNFLTRHFFGGTVGAFNFAFSVAVYAAVVASLGN